MAFLPLFRCPWTAETGFSPVRTGGENHSDDQKVSAAMEFLLLLLLLAVLAAAPASGLTADTRDSADWKPTDEGRRWRSRVC